VTSSSTRLNRKHLHTKINRKSSNKIEKLQGIKVWGTWKIGTRKKILCNIGHIAAWQTKFMPYSVSKTQLCGLSSRPLYLDTFRALREMYQSPAISINENHRSV